MGIVSEAVGYRARRALQICAVLVFCCASLLADQTNKTRVGLLPFINLSGQTNLDAWRKAFGDRLASELEEAKPPRLDVSHSKVLTALASNGWDGQQVVGAELAAKVAHELRLERLVSGGYNRDEKGWQVEVRITGPGGDSKEQVLIFKEASSQDLFSAMAEKICAALGVVPNPKFKELSKRYRVSNEAMDKVVAVARARECGVSNEVIIDGLRAVLATEPNYPNARVALMDTLFESKRPKEALAEARKLVRLAPEMCWGYIGVAVGLSGSEADEEREKACLQALKVHPGCPSAAGLMFPVWASEGRWRELKPVAQQAHEDLPEEPVSTAALAGALAAQGEQEAAGKLLQELGPLDDEQGPDVHGLVLLAAVQAKCIAFISRELLWLHRCGMTNEYARNLVGEMDASFWLSYPPGLTTTNPLPRLFSSPELAAELAKRLTPAEQSLVENPLEVTEAITAEARGLTAGLTNSTLKAAVLFAAVIEQRLQSEHQSTNTLQPGPLPVCHQYASRLVALARSIGLSAWLVHVEFVSEAASGYHDRAAIQVQAGQIIQFDPSLGVLGDPEDKYRMLNDVQAIAHHLLQVEDLPKVRVAQKLDPEDLWSRMVIVVRLSTLAQVDEAETLWKALPPACTNRWDYYFGRAAIELHRSHYGTALSWLQQAEALSPNNPAVHQALGATYSALNEHAKAAEHIDKAIKLGAAQQNPGLKADLMSQMQFRRDLAKAGQMTEQELRQQAAAGNPGAQMTLVNVLFERGDNDEAMTMLRDGANKGNSLFQENYARNLLMLSKGAAATEAADWLRKAALQESTEEACYLLAKILYTGELVPKDEAEASQWAHVGEARGGKNCHALLKEMELLADSAAFAQGKQRAQAILSKKSG